MHACICRHHLRACVRGPHGPAPGSDGGRQRHSIPRRLFFFDLHLPPSYPAEPPLVNYRSFGLHVNPNLYPSSTVCLSLVNTFGGERAEELWSPEASSILQVVVSIQGLVLAAQPYYNEPAHGAHAGTPQGRVYATSSRTVRTPTSSTSRPCSTSCAGHLPASRRLSETTFVAVGSMCSGRARHTRVVASSARSTRKGVPVPRRAAGGGHAPLGLGLHCSMSSHGWLRPSPLSTPKDASRRKCYCTLKIIIRLVVNLCSVNKSTVGALHPTRVLFSSKIKVD